MGLISLLGKRGFGHGIHPPKNKAQTASSPIRRLAFAPRLIVHLDQFIGAPATPLVKKGQEVVRGEVIAEASGAFSVPVHAPATGRVKGIELMPTSRGTRSQAIIIDVYEGDAQEVLYAKPNRLEELQAEDLLPLIQRTGLVGLGGAAFPTHMKYNRPDGAKAVDTLVVNGAECEPFLTADHRVMLEQPQDIVTGVRLAMKANEVEKAVIGVEKTIVLK